MWFIISGIILLLSIVVWWGIKGFPHPLRLFLNIPKGD